MVVIPGLTRATGERRSKRSEGAHPVFDFWIPPFVGKTPALSFLLPLTNWSK